VKAIVEVKTRIANRTLTGILNTSIENAKLLGHPIFNGIFAFEYNSHARIESLKRILERQGENGKFVNHLSLGPYIFVKHWSESAQVPSEDCNSDFFGIYDFRQNNGGRSKKLSFSYFISNLVYSTSEKELSDRLWLLFPVSGGKERYRTKTACLGN